MTSLRERAEALAAWWHRELTEYGHCTHTSTEKACEAWAAAFIATGPTLAVSPESADEGRGDELPRLIEVPSEEAMYALLCGLNYGEMPELACTWKGLAFVATLTDPDADYVNYIHADESGLSRCPTSCDNCGTADRIDDPWKPTYPVVALLAVVPNAERAAQDGTDTWWTTATSPARPAETARCAHCRGVPMSATSEGRAFDDLTDAEVAELEARDWTADEILRAISMALEASDFEVVADLLRRLALKAPKKAAAILAVIEATDD